MSHRAFWRFAIDEEPARHVADDLKITPNAVRKYKSRVLHRLRQAFGEFSR